VVYRLSAAEVRYKVGAVANEICKDIFSTYRESYPRASDVVAATLRHLPPVFNPGQLELIHGAQKIGTEYSMSLNEFTNMLSDIGVIGVVTKRIKLLSGMEGLSARFSYTEKSRIVPFAAEALCVHPIFTVAYASDPTKSNYVVPVGSNAVDGSLAAG